MLEKAEERLLPLIQYEGGDADAGWRARALLWTLARLSGVYRAVAQSRLYLYQRDIFNRSHCGCLIVSVGNVTVGGTGKTPMVELLAKALVKEGRKVAILSRGYRKKEKSFWQKLGGRFKSGDDAEGKPRVVSDGKHVLLDSEMSGDEPFMLAANVPEAVVIVDKNRVKSGRLAIRRFGCDILLLDDGFQYQKFPHRDTRDIVLVDSTNPFGNGACLPRGILREPAKNISRAKYVCITKAKGRDNAALRARIKSLNPAAEIMECSHEPCEVVNAFTRERLPLGSLRGLRVLALSGIASPRSFENLLEKLGAEIIERRRYADHHRFSEQETIDTVNDTQSAGCDALLTTEKDAVRMTLRSAPPIPVYFLRIEIRFLDGEDTFHRFVRDIVSP